MLTNLQKALGFILSDEGPELNIGGSEPGGASRFGVSVTALSDWHKQRGLPTATVADVSAMTADLAGQIYTHNFADPIRFNDLPGGVDYRLLDIAVNLGVTGGTTALQLALGMWPISGTMDAATMSAVALVDPSALVRMLSASWISKKHESANWPKYGRGWSARNARATVNALTMVTK